MGTPPFAAHDFAPPVVAWAGPDDASQPLVVLLHGRGADEHSGRHRATA